ncbi:cytochrome P450 family protein [Abortiporus biennis]
MFSSTFTSLPFPPTGVLIGIILLCRVVYTRWIRNKLSHRPPGPDPIPFFGNILQLPMEYQERAIWEMGKKYGNIIYARFFRRHTIMINSAEVAQDLLAKRSVNYSDRPPFILQCELMGWDSVAILMPYTARYRKHRKWIHDAFMNKNNLLTYRPMQKRETYTLLSGLMSTPEEFTSHFLRFTAGTIAEITFGHTVTGLNDIYIHLSDKAAGATVEAGSPGSMLVDFIPILKYWPTWLPGSSWKTNALSIRKLGKDMTDIPYDMVKQKMAAGTAKPSMVSSLIEEFTQKEGGLTAEDENDIKGAAAVLYGAGTETSANIFTEFILVMVKYPHIFKKAQEEIDRVIGFDRLPDFDDRESLPYLNCVIKELYRWHPPTPLGVPHYSMKDDEYLGYNIPAKSMMIANIWGMTRNADAYPNPEEFIPERFEDLEKSPSQVDLKDPYNLIFGFGRRQCPAQVFADLNIFLVVSNILATMDISRARDENGVEIDPPHAYKSGFVHHLLPFKCAIRPRSQKAVDMVTQFLASSI